MYGCGGLFGVGFLWLYGNLRLHRCRYAWEVAQLNNRDGTFGSSRPPRLGNAEDAILIVQLMRKGKPRITSQLL